MAAAKKKQTAPNQRHAVYVIAGKDTALVHIEAEKLIGSLLDESQREMGLLKADLAVMGPADIFDELRTQPFLSDKRVAIIYEADKFISENRESFEKYFDHPSPTGILILCVGTWDSRTRLAKRLPMIGQKISADSPSAKYLPGRLVSYASDTHQKKLSFNAAQLLVELVSEELSRLYSEIDKLALYADGRKTITLDDVEALCGHNRIYNAFGVIDAVLAGDKQRAIARLRRMLTEDRSAEYTIVGAFAYQFRRFFDAKVLINRRMNPGLVAKKLRIWGNVDGFFHALAQMSLHQIGSAIQQLATIDYGIKTGRRQASQAIEQFVLEMD